MKKRKKIIILTVSIVVVLLAVFEILSLYQNGAFKTKLQKLEEMADTSDITVDPIWAWDFYTKEIRGTRSEDRGKEFMLRIMENGIIGSAYLIDNPDYLTDSIDFLKDFQEGDPLYEQARTVLTAYQGMLDLSGHLTDPFEIYATPSAYYNKSVTLIGTVVSNDVQRRMLKLDIGNNRYFEVNYAYAGVLSSLLHEDPPEKSADEWLHTDYSNHRIDIIVATGMIKQYNDSTDAYLPAVRISTLDDVNWENISNYFS